MSPPTLTTQNMTSTALARESQPYSAAVYRSAQEAFVKGWKQAMCTGVVVMTLLLTFVVLRGPERGSETSA